MVILIEVGLMSQGIVEAGDWHDAGLILPSQDNPEWLSSLCHNLGGYSHWGRLNGQGIVEAGDWHDAGLILPSQDNPE